MFKIKIQDCRLLFTLIAVLNVFAGCYYYKSTPVKTDGTNPAWATDKISELQKANKYLIVHHKDNMYQKDSMWHLTYAKIVKDSASQSPIVIGYFSPVDAKYLPYIEEMNKKGMGRITKKETGTYKLEKKENVITQVHIYISEYKQNENNSVTIPLTKINSIYVFDPDKGKTIRSFLIPGAISVAVIVLIGVAIATSGCGCPYVYNYDGTNYNFSGNMFSGAVYPSLERDDYILLPDIVPVQNQYQFKIANTKKEDQLTNIFELKVVQHPDSTNVIPDKNGNIRTISHPESPLSAISFGRYNHLSEIVSKDFNSMFFNENEKTDSVNNLILSFKKPANARQGKFIINAKNTEWSAFIYNEFSALFGTAYQTWSEKQAKEPAEKSIKWELDQAIPMLVYLKTETGWKFVDYFNVVGSVAARDLVMPIDVSEIKSDKVELMLKTGFMFWDVDYAAMDFTDDVPVQISLLKPVSATDSSGNNYLDALSKDDTLYLKHYYTKEAVTITFNSLPANRNVRQTIMIHGKGYYKRLDEYTGTPNLMYLSKFNVPGAFSEFSKTKYFEKLNALTAEQK